MIGKEPEFVSNKIKDDEGLGHGLRLTLSMEANSAGDSLPSPEHGIRSGF